MNCRKVRLCLFSYFKNELSEKEKAEIKLHLEGCPNCAQESVEVERVTLLVNKSLETLTPSPDFNQNLLYEIQKFPSVAVKETPKPSFSPPRILGLEIRIKWALAGSLAAIILISALWFVNRRTPTMTESISEKSKKSETLQLVKQRNKADSLYGEMLERLMDESQFKTKTFVLDHVGLVRTRGIDGIKRPEDFYKRFIIETAGYGAEQRRTVNHYVLPVVSTQPVSAKVGY